MSSFSIKSLTVLLLSFVLIFSFFSISGYCKELETPAAFSTYELSDAEKETIEKNIDLTLLSEMNAYFGIDCFDVSDSGCVAVGIDYGTHKSIYVFDSDGNFDRGYDFSIDGSFNLEWDEDNILIYIVRGDIVVSVDRDGKVTNVKKIENTSENNSYWNKLRSTKSKTVDGKTYLMRNKIGIFNLFATSYSQIIVQTAESEMIIYDASTFIVCRNLFILIVIVPLFAVLAFSIIKRWKSGRSVQR